MEIRKTDQKRPIASYILSYFITCPVLYGTLGRITCNFSISPGNSSWIPAPRSGRGQASRESIDDPQNMIHPNLLRSYEFGDIIRLNPGALELITILKSMGFKIALLSSGFDFFIKRIVKEANIDYAFSNTLTVDDKGVITGGLEEPLITDQSKDGILEFIMSSERIDRDQVIAVGDASTRSQYIKNVGLSIAFQPREPSVTTDGILSSDNMINLLYCLGIPKAELDKYLRPVCP